MKSYACKVIKIRCIAQEPLLSKINDERVRLNNNNNNNNNATSKSNRRSAMKSAPAHGGQVPEPSATTPVLSSRPIYNHQHTYGKPTHNSSSAKKSNASRFYTQYSSSQTPRSDEDNGTNERITVIRPSNRGHYHEPPPTLNHKKSRHSDEVYYENIGFIQVNTKEQKRHSDPNIAYIVPPKQICTKIARNTNSKENHQDRSTKAKTSHGYRSSDQTIPYSSHESNRSSVNKNGRSSTANGKMKFKTPQNRYQKSSDPIDIPDCVKPMVIYSQVNKKTPQTTPSPSPWVEEALPRTSTLLPNLYEKSSSSLTNVSSFFKRRSNKSVSFSDISEIPKVSSSSMLPSSGKSKPTPSVLVLKPNDIYAEVDRRPKTDFGKRSKVTSNNTPATRYSSASFSSRYIGNQSIPVSVR